ncbi:MAG TPA: Holliday junction branch migration protein RuvA [Acidimicrobiales bacterium]|nr:Holliday junction branch migration protein RuvA [Acidimicrobiales bacterium]
MSGRLIARTGDGELLVDVQGVGYRVSVPTPLLVSTGEPGAEVTLHIHTHVREDAIVLYGFATTEERRCFEALLSAHGVGPSLALSVLCALRPADLVRAVLEEDLAVLCAVPGVGRKTAARLVLDLRTRLELPEFSGDGVPGGSCRTTVEPRGEVRAALAELGYAPEEIRRALHDIPDEGAVEEMLRRALRELASVR